MSSIIFVTTLALCCTGGGAMPTTAAPKDELFQGDIRLTDEQKAALSSPNPTFGLTRVVEHWPTIFVKYEIDKDLSKEKEAVDAIEKAVKYYFKYTCINLRKSASSYKKRIYFKKATHFNGVCSAPLGFLRNKTQHVVELAPKCYFYTYVIHLIMHALGFLHEHTRPDRDQFVEVYYKNTLYPAHYKYLFDKVPITLYPASYNVSKIPYDYMSILHPPFDWFKFGKRTLHPPVFTGINSYPYSIKTKDPRYKYEIGQRRGFSYYDQRRIGEAYGCARDQHGKYVYFENLKNDYVPDPVCYDQTNLCYEWEVKENRCKQIQTNGPDRWLTMKLCQRTCGLCKKNNGHKIVQS